MSKEEKNNSKYRQIGKIKDAHGLKGDLYVIFFSKDYSWIGDIEVFFLGESFKPYEVIKMSEHKDGLKVQVEGLSNRNESEALIGQNVYLEESFFASNDGDSLFLVEIENFEVFDQNTGLLIGTVVGFSNNGAHDNLSVKSQSNFQPQQIFDIPFVKDFVKDIDHTNKKINMILPEGLLAINEDES